MSNITTYQHQSPFDIAIQEHGSIEGVFDLLAANPGLEFDSDIASGTVLKLGGEKSKWEVVDTYQKYNTKPATGDTDGLLIYCENDGGMITKTYNYPLASGDKTFDGVRLYNLNKDVTVQINYTGIDADDVQVILESSLDGVNFTQVMEAAFILDKTKPMHTFTILGLVTSYLRLRIITGSATTGTIDEMLILV
ncbi:MAG: hypothetical protein QM503_04500 [Bacteroidota bacterium]